MAAVGAAFRSLRCGRAAVALTLMTALLAGCGSSGSVKPAAEAVTPGAAYTALGSSYAAGPGIPPNEGGRCLRSDRNYAHRVAKMLELNLTDATCSGALAANLGEPSLDGTAAQVSAVTPATRLVTLTVGGNDIGYAQSLARCTQLARVGVSCKESDAIEVHGATQLSGLRKTLVALLERIKTIAPTARIYLISYLAVLSQDGTSCPPNVPLLSADAIAFSQLGQRLRDTEKQAALTARVEFLDVYAASLTHTACAPAASRWVEGTRRVLPAFSYHPNARGMAAVADLLVAAIQQGS